MNNVTDDMIGKLLAKLSDETCWVDGDWWSENEPIKPDDHLIAIVRKWLAKIDTKGETS